MKYATPENMQFILTNYVRLMNELKERYSIVRNILAEATKRQFTLPPSILGELCYLQLRMICELIALGCVLVHGDVKETRTGKIHKKWHAGEIIKSLSRLHPPFYPVPTDQILDEHGKVISTVPISKNYLTKQRLLKLYAECGEILHRGNLNDIMSPKIRLIDLGKVATWATEITHLLNHHQIALIGGRSQIWVVMNANEDGGVHPFLMERYDGPLPSGVRRLR